MAKGKYSAKPQGTEPESPGKFMITLGGLIGFSGTFLCARYVGNSDWTNALFFASLACLLVALFMKTLAVYLEKNIDRIRRERYQAQRAARRKKEEDEMRAIETEMLQQDALSEDSE